MPPAVIVATAGTTSTEMAVDFWAREMMAVSDFVASALEVTVTDTALGEGMVVGAVYKPAPVIEPQAAPEHPGPLSDQVTPVVPVPVIAEVNCSVSPRNTVAIDGAMLTATGVDGETRLMVALDCALSNAEVAVTSTVATCGAVEGAVYKPDASTVPQAAAEHDGPETLQVTLELGAPLTVAPNCIWLDRPTTATPGVTATVMPVGVELVEVPVPTFLKNVGPAAPVDSKERAV